MGTRGSALALAQSGWLASELKKSWPELEVETVVIKTSGDLFAVQAPRKAYELSEGTKGLFVKEIEEALLAGRIDFAVHSAKDLPADLAPGLFIAAYPRREDPRDAFVGRGGKALAELARGAAVGTSSLRRKIQLLQARPDLEVVPLRGNVDTRLKKLERGEFEGLLLAYAGLSRLGRASVPHEKIPVGVMLPAPAQGALAAEAREDRPEVASRLARLDHSRTRLEVEFERAFLKACGGGCSVPLGALARAEGASVELSIFWSDPEGRAPRRLSGVCRDLPRRDSFAAELARECAS